MALLCAGYGWTPDIVAALNTSQLAYFLHHLPLIEMRKQLPIAQLEAAVKNMMGGKPDPQNKDAKTIPPERLYTAFELLQWYAQPEGLELRAVSPAAAKDLLKHLGHLPEWALEIADLGALKQAAG